jgi:hypothetical protein
MLVFDTNITFIIQDIGYIIHFVRFQSMIVRTQLHPIQKYCYCHIGQSQHVWGYLDSPIFIYRISNLIVNS